MALCLSAKRVNIPSSSLAKFDLTCMVCETGVDVGLAMALLLLKYPPLDELLSALGSV